MSVSYTHLLDAQYWGVPQRRKRIFLVADFAGRSARQILFDQESLPGHPAQSLSLIHIFAEFSRLWIIAQGVKEAAQQAVISTVNDNYDDVYHAVREGYACLLYTSRCV